MVKVYYQYTFTKPIAMYTYNNSNISLLKLSFNHQSNKIKYIVSAANQYVVIICPKTGYPIKFIINNHKRNLNHTSLVRFVNTSNNRIYVGYQNGTIVSYLITDMLLNYQVQFLLNTHSSHVTCLLPSSLEDSPYPTHLFSASASGNIAIYDILSQETQKIQSAHKGPVTQLYPISLLLNGVIKNCLLTIGKDGYFKIWDLSNFLCIGIIGMIGQALSFYVDAERQLIYVGMDNQKINIIKINSFVENSKKQSQSKICEHVGTIIRQNYSQAVQMLVSQANPNYLYILNSDKAIEVFQFQSSAQVDKKKKRLNMRKKQKQSRKEDIQQNQIPMRKASHNSEMLDQKDLKQGQINQYQLGLKFIGLKQLLQKYYNFAINGNTFYLNGSGNIYVLTIQDASNIQTSSLSKLTHSTGKTFQLQLEYPFIIQRSIRQISIFPNSVLQGDSDKFFKNKLGRNISSNNRNQKLFTIQEKEDIKWCKIFNQGFLLLITTKKVSIYDLAKNQQVFTKQESWAGCWIRGSNCLLWRQNIIGKFQLGYNKQKQIQLKLISQHRCNEKIKEASSFNNSFTKYLLNLQNNSIAINYCDTHKNFLTLHGHKLPITCFSVASDDNIMATGSVDKDIRLWDLQFGHSMKTIFAHKSPVTAVQFMKDTHYLWTGGRDGIVKMWDMDTYELVIQLDQVLNGQIKDIKISSNGQYLIAGGVDGGFRIWSKSENQVVAGDQQQKNNEKILIQDYAQEKLKKRHLNPQGENNQGQQQQQQEIQIKYDDLKDGQQIIQCLQNMQHPCKLVQLIKRIGNDNLRGSLSFLHRKHVTKLQNYIQLMIREGYQVELCYRVLDNLRKNVKNGLNNNLNKIKSNLNKGNLNILNQKDKKNNYQGNCNSVLRQKWNTEMKILSVNREMLRLLGKSIKQEKQLI